MGTRALVLSLAVSIPSMALAQTAGQATVTIVGTLRSQINRADCGSTAPNVSIGFLPSVTGTFHAGQDVYEFFASTSACSTTLPTSGSFAANETAATVNRQSLTVSGDALRAALGLSCTQANDATYYVCIYLVSTSAQIVGTASSSAQTFQLAVPPAPSISVASANGALDVDVTPGTADSTYTATSGITYQATATPSAGGASVSSALIASTSLRIEGLTNNTPYDVVAYAYSSASNQSPPSATVTGTPLPFKSFWELYQDANGREQGGCGGGAGALSLLALLPLALRRRRP